MNFDRLDDSEPFVADRALRESVRTEGVRRRRRRSRRNRIALSSCTAMLLVASILGYGAWTTTRIDRVHVGFEAPPVDMTRPFDVLLIGSDRRPGDVVMSDRADAAMIVHVDPTTNRISVLSIPRDLAIQGQGGPRVAELLDGGPGVLADVIQSELGIPLSSYVQISFEGLVTIADTFGGVDVGITENSFDLASGLDLDASTCTRLDGDQLLAALRSRHLTAETPNGATTDPTGDSGRRARQRALIAILFSQTGRLSSSPDALDRIIDVAVTDLVVDDRIDLSSMISIARWLTSTSIDVTVDDLPADWVTAEDQRRVLILGSDSFTKVRSFTSAAIAAPDGARHPSEEIQPFRPCE